MNKPDKEMSNRIRKGMSAALITQIKRLIIFILYNVFRGDYSDTQLIDARNLEFFCKDNRIMTFTFHGILREETS